MTSIFDLKTSTSELSSSNHGTTRAQYEQQPPTRDITGNNFSNGAIHFRFSTSGTKWWIPSRSYIRTRFALTKGDGTPIQVVDEVAPNMGLNSSLYQSCEFRVADKTVSRIPDFVAQVDALETRLCKSKGWLESVGESSNFWGESQQLRASNLSLDGEVIEGKIPVSTTSTVSGATLSYQAPTTVSYDQATGLINFNTGVIPDSNTNWQIGDYFVFTINGDVANGVQLKVLEIPDGSSLRVEPLVPDVASAVVSTNTFNRVRPASAQAEASRRIGSFETTWTPPLSIFKINHAIPAGKYELVLNPQTATSFQKRAIESLLGSASKNPTLVGAGVGDFKLSVVDMYLYVYTVEGPRCDSQTYLLDLEQTRCQSEKIDNVSFQQKAFDVSSSTYALSCAYQDLRAGENTAISVSKFKSYENSNAPSVQQELGLNRFFCNFAGMNLPSPDSDPLFDTGVDYTTQRYVETQLNSGAYFDSGGTEDIETYHDRGSYYYIPFPRDATDRSTRVNVHQQFKAGTDVSNMRVLLFDHSKQVCRISVQNGQVVQVDLEDV